MFSRTDWFSFHTQIHTRFMFSTQFYIKNIMLRFKRKRGEKTLI